MDSDIERAIEYILSGELEQSKQKTTATSKGVLNSIKHFTRSKSQLRKPERSPSRNSSAGMDDEDDEQLRLAVAISLQHSHDSVVDTPPRAPPPSLSPPRSNSPYFGPARGSDYTES